MIRHRRRRSKFVLGRGSEASQFGSSKLQYRKNIEKALLATLMLAILFFRISTSVDIGKYLIREKMDKFEFIDILDIPPVIEPPQQLQSQNVVEVLPDVEEEVPEDVGQVKEIMDQIEEMLAEDDSESDLKLASKSMSNYLLSSSPMSGSYGTDLDFRKQTTNDANLKLASNNRYAGDVGSGELNIGSTKTSRRKIETAETNLELGEDKRGQRAGRKRQNDEQNSLKLKTGPGKIISFSSSTIGTEDYKLWNKIISELDRLNKGRYGSESDAIKRDRGGFVISFAYNDNTRHEINWRNDGNIWIRVLGESRRTTNQELKQALGGLLRLSL